MIVLYACEFELYFLKYNKTYVSRLFLLVPFHQQLGSLAHYTYLEQNKMTLKKEELVKIKNIYSYLHTKINQSYKLKFFKINSKNYMMAQKTQITFK